MARWFQSSTLHSKRPQPRATACAASASKRSAGAQLPSGLKFVGLCVGGALILVFAIERLLTGDYVPAQED